jgi:hypothetical protein
MVFDIFKRLVELRPDIGLEVANVRPVRRFRDEKSVLVGIIQLTSDDIVRHSFGFQIFGHLFAFLIEQIAHPLKEEHAEDVFLILRSIHIPAQIIARAEQETGKLAESKFDHWYGMELGICCRFYANLS